MEQNEILKRSLDKWGFNLQKVMMMEECAELIKAISKEIRKGRHDLLDDSVCEEIADVEIMIEQMKMVYNKEIIHNWKIKKLLRLEKLLNESGE